MEIVNPRIHIFHSLSFRVFSTTACKLPQPFQPFRQYCRVEFVKAAVETKFGMIVASALPVVSNAFRTARELFLLCHDHPRIAKRAEVLGWIKAICSSHTKATGKLAAPR